MVILVIQFEVKLPSSHLRSLPHLTMILNLKFPIFSFLVVKVQFRDLAVMFLDQVILFCHWFDIVQKGLFSDTEASIFPNSKVKHSISFARVFLLNNQISTIFALPHIFTFYT